MWTIQKCKNYENHITRTNIFKYSIFTLIDIVNSDITQVSCMNDNRSQQLLILKHAHNMKHFVSVHRKLNKNNLNSPSNWRGKSHLHSSARYLFAYISYASCICVLYIRFALWREINIKVGGWISMSIAIIDW